MASVSRTSVVASGFVILWALALALIMRSVTVDGTPHRELASLAMGSAFGAVAVAVLIGEMRGVQWLPAAGGCALVAMSLVTFSPAAFPFLVPAWFLMWRGFTRPVEWSWPVVTVAVGMVILAFGSVASLILRDDPAEWSTGRAHHSSSNIITKTEATLSFSLSALVLTLAVVAPRGPTRTPDAHGRQPVA